MSKREDHIKDFWNKNPVGTNFIDFETGREYFEKYDEFRYKTEGHILEELDAIDFQNKKVLEIGLGQGADSMQIVKRGARYNGIDLTPESVRRVKQRFEISEIPYESVIEGSATNIPFDANTFDIVYSHGVIHHSPHIQQIVEEIRRVLKPGGEAVIMLYHKNSFNYHVSIKLMRRMGLFVLWLMPFTVKILSKVTGEKPGRIEKHIKALKKQGLKYLKMKNFIHVSTDGPDNVFSSVWSKKSSLLLFEKFTDIRFRIHFLNERHLLGFQYLLPQNMKNRLSARVGWHLWVKARKKPIYNVETEGGSDQGNDKGVLPSDIDFRKNLGCG